MTASGTQPGVRRHRVREVDFRRPNKFTRELTMGDRLGLRYQVARAAKEAHVGRFVLASSCSMYGAADSGEAVDESAPLSPLTAYAESKVQSEESLPT